MDLFNLKKFAEKKTTRLFFDMEFTGLHQKTTPISIGIVSEDGDEFYAEFNDYDESQVDSWIEENVIKNLTGKEVGTKEEIVKKLKKFLEQFENIEIWSDCLSYDWMLFCEFFGGAMNLPKNIYYIPFDLCSFLKFKGIDPDISREEFAEVQDSKEKHNSLFDAKIIKKCFLKLQS